MGTESGKKADTITRCEEHAKAGRHDEAIECFEDLLETDPENATL